MHFCGLEWSREKAAGLWPLRPQLSGKFVTAALWKSIDSRCATLRCPDGQAEPSDVAVHSACSDPARNIGTAVIADPTGQDGPGRPQGLLPERSAGSSAAASKVVLDPGGWDQSGSAPWSVGCASIVDMVARIRRSALCKHRVVYALMFPPEERRCVWSPVWVRDPADRKLPEPEVVAQSFSKQLALVG